MDEQETGKFKLGIDEAADEVDASSLEIESDPIDHKQLPTGIYVLLGILIIGMVGVSADLYRRVMRSRHIGANQAESLDTRLSHLTAKQTILTEQLTQKIASDKETMAGLDETLGQTQASLQTIQKQLAEKAGQSELNSAVKKGLEQIRAETEAALKKVGTLTADFEKLSSTLATTQENLSGEIGEVTLQLDRVSKNLIELKTKVTALASTKIDKQTAESLVKRRLASQPAVSGQVSKTLSEYGQEIEALKRNINGLKKNAIIYENEILKMKRQLVSPEARPSGSPAMPTSEGKNDGISQQNLNE